MNGKKSRAIRRVCAQLGGVKRAQYQQMKRIETRGTPQQAPAAVKERKHKERQHKTVRFVDQATGETAKALSCSLVGCGPNGERRLWREGEPVHVLKPVKRARQALVQRDAERGALEKKVEASVGVVAEKATVFRKKAAINLATWMQTAPAALWSSWFGAARPASNRVAANSVGAA